MAAKKVKVTKEDVFEFIKNMSVMDLADFVKEMEEIFGVTAMPATLGPGVPAEVVPEKQEPTGWQIILDGYDAERKIPVIKAVRAEISGLGLKEAKEFVESAPQTIQESCLSEIEAKRIKEAIEADGGQVSINPIF